VCVCVWIYIIMYIILYTTRPIQLVCVQITNCTLFICPEKPILSEKLRSVLTNCAKSMIGNNRSVCNRWIVITIITRIIVYSLRPNFSDPPSVIFPARLSMIGNGSDRYYIITDFKDTVIALTCSVDYRCR